MQLQGLLSPTELYPLINTLQQQSLHQGEQVLLTPTGEANPIGNLAALGSPPPSSSNAAMPLMQQHQSLAALLLEQQLQREQQHQRQQQQAHLQQQLSLLKSLLDLDALNQQQQASSQQQQSHSLPQPQPVYATPVIQQQSPIPVAMSNSQIHQQLLSLFQSCKPSSQTNNAMHQ